jgi:hypothetical protein
MWSARIWWARILVPTIFLPYLLPTAILFANLRAVNNGVLFGKPDTAAPASEKSPDHGRFCRGF